MRLQLERQLDAADRNALQAAGQLAADLGMRLFLAGGSVRDMLLDRAHEDWDVVLEGDGPTFARALAERQRARAVVHERFLTAAVTLEDGRAFDIATSRRERYPRPGALPVVEPACIEEDLWRRDFSINAIAVALTPGEWGEVLDPAGGISDIQARLVRALHERSFWDDATRIIRAIGFEQRLGFTIEADTEHWIRQAAQGGALQTVSTERLGEVIVPLLANAVGPRALKRANELGVARALGARAVFTRRSLKALEETPEALEQLGETDDGQRRLVACLAAALLSRGVDAEQVITRLHLTRFIARELRAAQRYLELWPRGFAPAARPGDLWEQLREASFGGVVALWLASLDAGAREALARYWRTLRDATPDIGADEFKAGGYAPSPAFAEALRAATRAKLDENADRAAQLAAARRVLNGEENACR